ncbi:MAG: FMN-binding glutamate synthase family protein [Candidatus Lokiarchaeota archaeon]|nr:FMN-binding glutamate synthase family protein [Candidatus Lokiarchaeota archaeon]
MSLKHIIPSKFKVSINQDSCKKCKRCVTHCSYGCLSWNGSEIVSDDDKCVACQRCALYCPGSAITIEENKTLVYPPHGGYPARIRRIIQSQSGTGGVMLSSTGNDLEYRTIFDDILLDACQVTNPSIDPLREPVETKVFLGRKPEKLEFQVDPVNPEKVELKSEFPPNFEMEIPVMVGHMSLGSISFNACKAIYRAVTELGIVAGSGEGGLHKEFYEYKKNLIPEVASGRFGVNLEYLLDTVAVEIKIGQGAKPGHGGHLPGEKVNKLISTTRMIPKGSDALSPYPHHDIYSIEDLAQLIAALKETTRYRVPIGVKIAAVHNVAPIASGIVRAGADFLTLDGFRGSTGAAPRIIRDHAGIPIEVAIASVDERLREEGLREKVTIIAGGSIRYSADLIKAIALGADIGMCSMPVLVAMGCRMCQQCHRGLCSWGIATQKDHLVKRLDVDVATRRFINLFHAWKEELKEILGAMGIDSVESLRGNRDRLRYIGPNPRIADILDIKHVGE